MKSKYGEYGYPSTMTAEEIKIYYPELNIPYITNKQIEKELSEIHIDDYPIKQYESKLYEMVNRIINQ